MSLRVIFMGTPDFAVPVLTEIVGQGHEVVSCYTRAPAQAGRGLELKPSPVHRAAERFGIPVFTPRTLKTPEQAEIIASQQADVAVGRHRETAAVHHRLARLDLQLAVVALARRAAAPRAVGRRRPQPQGDAEAHRL